MPKNPTKLEILTFITLSEDKSYGAIKKRFNMSIKGYRKKIDEIIKGPFQNENEPKIIENLKREEAQIAAMLKEQRKRIKNRA